MSTLAEVGEGSLEQSLAQLVPSLQEALCSSHLAARTQRVKRALEHLVREHLINLPERFYVQGEKSYARRLLYQCPESGTTAIVMCWGPGQQTCLHDHAGMWCVECVIDGEIEVVQYDVVDEEGDLLRFEEQATVRAGVGEAGALMPPFEYHVLRNPSADRVCLTLHVYAGEMTECTTFLPVRDGWYRRNVLGLSYDV
jgi:predicted metal-dependent enzyme (double-stranded beta helix superfamily)